MTHPTDFKYRAFLSYSHADTPLAKWLHGRLERFPLRGLAGRETALGPVPKQLRPIFRDRLDFSAGATVNDQTAPLLEASAALIVLCSPASAKSAAVNEEVRLFRHRWPDRLIVPVILAGKPNAGAQECFPPALRFALDAEGQATDQPEHTPIAPDIPEEGRELALAKVVAALIGVPSDEVFQRWKRERKRQAFILNAIAGLVLLLSVIGGYFAWQWRRGVAELTDITALVDQYAPPGSAQAQQPGARERLRSAFEAIAKGTATDPRYKQALDLIKARKPKEAEPLLRESAEEEEAAGLKRLKQAAEKWRNLGTIAGYADPKRARECYAKAAKLDPNNIKGMFWHAFMEQHAGSLADAERAYNTVIAVGVKGQDDFELYWARVGLGDIRVTRGDLLGALSLYREASSDTERLTKADPGNAEWQYDLGISNERIGNAQMAQGELTLALKSYEAKRDIVSRLAKSDPGNAGWQRDLSVSYIKVGDVLVDQGNLGDALKAYRDSLAIAERLAKSDPGNAGWRRDLSVAYEKVGDVLVDQGNLPEARDAYRDGLAIAERLAKSDPGNAGWQYDLGISNERAGDVQMAQGDLAAALKSYEAKRDIISRLAKSDPGNAEWQADLAASHGKLGQLYVRMGDKAEARRMFERGRAIVAPFAEKSGHQVWIGYLKSFDKELAALGK